MSGGWSGRAVGRSYPTLMDDVRYTLRQLEYFIAVAAEGTITGAAERCSVSATAATRQRNCADRRRPASVDPCIVTRQRSRTVSVVCPRRHRR
ncbi:helix-turn-helix domain-containing protein, partial [Rhodococcus sp. LB1]|uniref:helix-turn-helix domain-containing protein n=1 Tax=Rhodococcus sp. LB1 TaxID=1807499 RepID=UPI0012E92B60